jgi:hypothetical protein
VILPAPWQFNKILSLALSNKKNRLRAMQNRFSASNRIKLLRQFKSIFKTALAHESGDPGVPFKEKKPRVENLVRLSL